MVPQNGPRQTGGYIDVDRLQRELAGSDDALERIAAFYNVSLPELHKRQNETRMACIFACDKNHETGDRALAVKTKTDGVIFRCFQYGCTVRGNLLHLMHWLKHDREPTGGSLKGQEFKEIATDLQAVVEGHLPDTETRSTPERLHDDVNDETLINVPLKDSDNERARELVNLDEQFITNVAQMSPKAAAYVRQRPFLTPEMMQKFRCGYLPNSAKGLLRGQFVYGYSDAEGNILTWFGRNLNYEEQFKKWQRSGDSSREPAKFKFVKGFNRGQELFGLPQFNEVATPEQIRQTGIVLVEGSNDVINLHRLGVPALAVCSNTVTVTQVTMLAEMANSVPGGYVSVMFDLDAEGENGAKQAVLELAQHCRVTLAWTRDTSDGQYKGQQPESLVRNVYWTNIKHHLP